MRHGEITNRFCSCHKRGPTSPLYPLVSFACRLVKGNKINPTYQSVACQASSKDDARTASELALEKLAMPSWRPFNATPPWWKARLRVSVDCDIQAR